MQAIKNAKALAIATATATGATAALALVSAVEQIHEDFGDGMPSELYDVLLLSVTKTGDIGEVSLDPSVEEDARMDAALHAMLLNSRANKHVQARLAEVGLTFSHNWHEFCCSCITLELESGPRPIFAEDLVPIADRAALCATVVQTAAKHLIDAGFAPIRAAA